MTPDEEAIRHARDELNRAIVARETAPFAKYWLDNVAITAGGGDVLGNSRSNHVKRFVAVFADPDFVHGERRTSHIEINAVNGLAAEHGEWTWQYERPAGLQDSQGTYLVMWRKVKSDWRIQSELYVMVRCVGPGCGS